MTRYEYTKLGKLRRRSALLFALILHVTLAIIFLFIPNEKVIKEKDIIAVEWVKDAPKQKILRPKTKPTLKMKVYRPDQRLAREARNKLVQSSPNKITEVAQISLRIVHENIEVSKAAPSEKIPELMTAAELRDAEASNLERLVSRPGRTDGRGELTGRMRTRGQGTGRFLVDSFGDSEDGLLGGGGSQGIADKLDIIKFIDEFEGSQQVVYCLDVSASMQAAGLRKLELAIQSIKDSLLMLNDDDAFNLITFSARAKVWKRKMMPATMDNVEKALKHLDRFTPKRIANNQGTNILEAIEKALEINSSIIVLVTDGIPVASRNARD
ncbi:MAG: VWA domain-containing protein, partial [Candidatus Poribacteria bacterium]|nr:VWA domain-containing protein [Candidatus Poribacteria bacterium]